MHINLQNIFTTNLQIRNFIYTYLLRMQVRMEHKQLTNIINKLSNNFWSYFFFQ